MLPLTAPWGGHREPSRPSLFPPDSPPLLWARTDGSTPFRLCLHEGDVGHTLIVGATGAGKSVLVGLLLAQWRRYAESADGDVRRRLQPLRVRAARWARRITTSPGPMSAGRPGRDAAAPRRGPARGPAVGRRLARSRSSNSRASRLTPGERGRLAHAVALLADNPPEGRTLTALLVNLGSRSACARSSARTRWRGRTVSPVRRRPRFFWQGRGCRTPSGRRALAPGRDVRPRVGPGADVPVPARRGIASTARRRSS